MGFLFKKFGIGYDEHGFNVKGYNKEGFDNLGYDVNGYDKEGYKKDGFDKNGFDKKGYNKGGLDKNGFGEDGYNEDGFDRKGFDKDGYTKYGYDNTGYDRDGYNFKGYNKAGFEKPGNNRGKTLKYQVTNWCLEKYYGDEINLVIVEGLSHKELPVNQIGASFMAGNRALKSVTIPKGFIDIEQYAFKDCTSLESVIFPAGFKKIGKGAFENCQLLKTVILPDGFLEIGTETFKDCISLESILIPSGCKRIGYGAFKNCRSLKSITIPVGIERIEAHTFLNCSNLEELIIPEGVLQIEWAAVALCDNLKQLTIPDSVQLVKCDFGELEPENLDYSKATKAVPIPMAEEYSPFRLDGFHVPGEPFDTTDDLLKKVSDIDIVLGSYHPYRGGRNKNFDEFSKRILNIKEGKREDIEYMAGLVDETIVGSCALCMVPTSDGRDRFSCMKEIIKIIADDKRIDASNALIRKYPIDKLSRGGRRNMSVHLDSICCIDRRNIFGKVVVLLDDVTTTGNSIAACKKILLDAGAEAVFPLCLAYTVKDPYDYDILNDLY